MSISTFINNIFNISNKDKKTIEGTLILIDDPDLFYIDTLFKRTKKYTIKSHITNINIEYKNISLLSDINIKETLSEKLYKSLSVLNFDNKAELLYNIKIFNTYRDIFRNNIYNTDWICIIQNTLNVDDEIFREIKNSIEYFKDTDWDIIIIGKTEIIKYDDNDIHTINYKNYINLENTQENSNNKNIQNAIKVLEFRRLEGFIIKQHVINKILHYFDKMEFYYIYDIINKLISINNLNVYSFV